MVEPVSPLVHTDEGAPTESSRCEPGNGSTEPPHRRKRSSAVEHPLHTGRVAGSIPAVSTVDPISDMLTDDAWRMNVEERFWPKVMRPMAWDECWPWQGGKKGCDRDGYGTFKIRSYVSVRAHRVSFALYNGRSPGAWLVLHSCDNPPCVNPAHLRLGTVKDNSDDMVARGRQAKRDQAGEANGAAKLSATDVEKVRELILAGLTNKAIALRYGVTHSLISRIRRGKAWGSEPMQPKYASLKRTA